MRIRRERWFPVAGALGVYLMCFVAILGLSYGWGVHWAGAVVLFSLLTAIAAYAIYVSCKQWQSSPAQVDAVAGGADGAARAHFDPAITELWAPLVGAASTMCLLKGTELSEEQKTYVDSLASTIRVLHALSDDLASGGASERPAMTLEATSLDLGQAVFEVCTAFAAPALERGNELICDIDPQLPAMAAGDGVKIQRILFPVIGKAINSARRGEVVVRANLVDAEMPIAQSHVVLEVRGTAGVRSPQQQDFKGDGALSMAARAVGGSERVESGFSMVRKYASSMGGDIAEVNDAGTPLTRINLPLVCGHRIDEQVTADYSECSVVAWIVESNAYYREMLVRALNTLGIRSRILLTSGQLHAAAETLGGGQAPDLLVVSDSHGGCDPRTVVEIVHGEYGWRVPVIYLCHPGDPVLLDVPLPLRLNKPFLARHFKVLVERCLSSQEPGASGAGAVSGLERRSEQSDKALVAEDNSVSAKILAALLTRLGYGVTVVRNGKQALARLQVDDYCAVFVDLGMPEMDGITFARHYRASEPKDQHIPIIAVTANVSEDVKRSCMAAGMDDYLTKPLVQGELESVMRRHARRIQGCSK